MAIGVFKLTKSQRVNLSYILLGANGIPMLIGLILIFLSLYVYLFVSPILYSERAEINFVFTVVGMMGTYVLGNSVAGLKITWKCINHAHKKSTRKLLLLWTCVLFFLALWLLILAAKARKVNKHIIRSMKHSFYIGMRNYLKDENWKLAIDSIQYDLQCCGIVSYEDWHEVSWLDKYHVNQNADVVKNLRATSDDWKLPVTPWSCCKINFPMQCLHDPLQQIQSIHIWTDEPNLVMDSLNTKGCLSILRVPVEVAVTIFILFAVLNFIIDIIIFLMTRILYTSCRNALILDDPEGVAPGWIFGRGDCGYARGKTLAEIMESEPNSSKNTTHSTDTTVYENMSWGNVSFQTSTPKKPG